MCVCVYCAILMLFIAGEGKFVGFICISLLYHGAHRVTMAKG